MVEEQFHDSARNKLNAQSVVFLSWLLQVFYLRENFFKSYSVLQQSEAFPISKFERSLDPFVKVGSLACGKKVDPWRKG